MHGLRQVFFAKKLDLGSDLPEWVHGSTSAAPSGPVTGRIRQRIKRGGERLWRLEDFGDLPFSAVAKALSRLHRQGMIERLSKGVYYRSRNTALGKSRPDPTDIRKLASHRKTVFPSGLAAANLLCFTTQMGRQGELATSLARKLVGQETVVHKRRPEAWADLSETEAALLDFLRHRGKFRELAMDDTIRKILALLSKRRRFERILRIADSEGWRTATLP